jgi:glutathione S-transferase
MDAYPLTSLGTILIVAYTFYASMGAGSRRGEVKAPAVSGDYEFEKAFRVHYNTIEQLVLFLPVLWLAAPYWGDLVSGGVAAVWLIGRLIYGRAYKRDPSTRSVGFLITLLATFAAFVAACIPLVMMLF